MGNDEIIVTQPVKVGDVVFLVHDVPARRTPAAIDEAHRQGLNEWILEADVVRRVHRIVMLDVVRRGLISGDAFKRLRKMARMKAAEVAELFGVSPTSVSHWETGKHKIPNTAWAIMALLALGEDARTALEAASRPRKPDGDVDLQLAA